jgi:hypothetical protein
MQNKQRSNCEATEHDGKKVHVCINKNWEFHLVTFPKCQKKLPSSILKTARVKLIPGNFRFIVNHLISGDIIGVRIRSSS